MIESQSHMFCISITGITLLHPSGKLPSSKSTFALLCYENDIAFLILNLVYMNVKYLQEVMGQEYFPKPCWDYLLCWVITTV